MIIYVPPAERLRYREYLHQYYKLRKFIFCDTLKWVPPPSGELETDRFDSLFNVYILYIDDKTGSVAGGVRLMPTMGPTLLHDVWFDMLPDGETMRSAAIWEATRFCIDESVSSRKQSLLNRATLSLSFAIAEFAHTNQIEEIVAICERYFFEMSGVFGPKARMLSSRQEPQGPEIYCGVWEVSDIRKKLSWTRPIIGKTEALRLEDVA